MGWQPYDNRGVEGSDDYDPFNFGMEYNFNIEVYSNDLFIAASDGVDAELFYQEMFEKFQITIDQLEGEITLPYEYIREQTQDGNIVQQIKIPRSPLGGFAEFRLNYQYIDSTNETVYSGEDIIPRVLVHADLIFHHLHHLQ